MRNGPTALSLYKLSVRVAAATSCVAQLEPQKTCVLLCFCAFMQTVCSTWLTGGADGCSCGGQHILQRIMQCMLCACQTALVGTVQTRNHQMLMLAFCRLWVFCCVACSVCVCRSLLYRHDMHVCHVARFPHPILVAVGHSHSSLAAGLHQIQQAQVIAPTAANSLSICSLWGSATALSC